MSVTELLALPVATDLRTAARALGIPADSAYRLVAAGKFPVPVRRYGREWRVSRASIFRELDLDPLLVSRPPDNAAPASAGWPDELPGEAIHGQRGSLTAAVSDPGYTEVGLEALHLLTVGQVAELLGVCARTVWRLIHCGELKPVRIGKAVRVAPEDLAAYIGGLRRTDPG